MTGAIVLQPRQWRFTVTRTSGHHELLEVEATSSSEAIRALPADVTCWDYAQFDNGDYSIPVDLTDGPTVSVDGNLVTRTI